MPVDFLKTEIKYLKGIGPKKALKLIQKLALMTQNNCKAF